MVALTQENVHDTINKLSLVSCLYGPDQNSAAYEQGRHCLNPGFACADPESYVVRGGPTLTMFFFF